MADISIFISLPVRLPLHHRLEDQILLAGPDKDPQEKARSYLDAVNPRISAPTSLE